MDVIVQGGWVLWLLIVMSVYSLATIGFLSVQARSVVVPADTTSSTSQVITCLQTIVGSNASLQPAALQEKLTAAAYTQFTQFRQSMRPLEIIAAAAPLVGLLGTVLGMIDAFSALSQIEGQIDPAVLAGGIWKALLTTAAGLLVAIPALVAWHMLDKKVEQSAARVNQFIVDTTAGA